MLRTYGEERKNNKTSTVDHTEFNSSLEIRKRSKYGNLEEHFYASFTKKNQILPRLFYLQFTPASAARWGLLFRLLPLWRNPFDLVDSSVLDRVPSPFSSLTGSSFSFTCELLLLLFPFSAAGGLFISLLTMSQPFTFSLSSSSIFSASSSSISSFNGFCGLPLRFCAGIFSSSPLPASSWFVTVNFLPFPRPLPILFKHSKKEKSCNRLQLPDTKQV